MAYVLSGGSLIGQGTYGCIFDPPLKCEDKTIQVQTDHLGKATFPVDFMIESEAGKALRDLKVPYFILPDYKSACVVNTRSSENTKDCRVMQKKKEEDKMIQFTMPYGGSTLYSRITDKSDIDFFSAMIQLLEAGAYLIGASYVHFDISVNNAVINDKGHISLIDFGQSFSPAELNEDTLKLRMKVFHPPYEAEAPELTILYGLTDKRPISDTIPIIMKQKRVFANADSMIGLRMARQQADLREFFQNSRSIRNGDWLGFFKLYWPTFDSWSIGVILLNVLRPQLFRKEFVESENWKLRGPLVKSILRGLLQTNPRKRIDAVQALKMYDPANAWFEKYGTSWLESRSAVV